MRLLSILFLLFSLFGLSVTHAEEKALTDQHPLEIMGSAKRVFESGQKDHAVFLYYLGQLRVRYWVLANKGKETGVDEGALMSSLIHSVGPTINEYAFGNLPKLRKAIDDAILWDEENPNKTCPKERNAEARKEVLQGLSKLRQMTIKQADYIRENRLKNGLENE